MSKKELPKRGGGVVIAPNLIKKTTVIDRNGRIISETVTDPNENNKESNNGDSSEKEG